MPYIKKEKRDDIIQDSMVVPDFIDCAGDLNFTFTWLIKRYIEKKGISYQTMNDVMGAITGCQLEFYRTTVGPLEKEKQEQNGDVE